MNAAFARQSVTTEAAHHIIAAAERKARELGTPMVIAIVDESGVLKAFSRMDGAALLSVQIAQDKAYTAAGFGLSTDQWHDFIKNDPPLAAGATAGISRLVVFGGGYPIKAGDQVIGGIGVSGGHYTAGHGGRAGGFGGTGRLSDGRCCGDVPSRSHLRMTLQISLAARGRALSDARTREVGGMTKLEFA